LFNGSKPLGTDTLRRRLFEGADWNLEYDSESGEGGLTDIHERLVTCMYFALTTLATVGYGDYSPCSVSEKIVGSAIQILGVTFFSVLMNQFIDVVLSMRTASGFNNSDDKLQNWFDIIKFIKNQKHKNKMGTDDIPPKLRERVEAHFRYFWENDRTFVLSQRSDYFNTIPLDIQHFIVCNFLFEDILNIKVFEQFFAVGKDFDSNFVYEVCFGFMPRQFRNNPEDRYMYEEESEVTEIYFITKGEWAVAFNSYWRPNETQGIDLDDDLIGPDDMM
jgi:hypothetical protein